MKLIDIATEFDMIELEITDARTLLTSLIDRFFLVLPPKADSHDAQKIIDNYAEIETFLRLAGAKLDSAAKRQLEYSEELHKRCTAIRQIAEGETEV